MQKGPIKTVEKNCNLGMASQHIPGGEKGFLSPRKRTVYLRFKNKLLNYI